MLVQKLTHHQRAARARAFAHTQSTPPQLEVLNAQVASLQQTVLTLQAEVNALQKELAAVQANNVQALDPFVSVDPNPEVGVAGPNIIFSGANIHIVSGSGATNDGGTRRGLGNLIIGYDEDPTQPGSPLNPGDRGGSHNLVIGARHRFTQAAFGGLVVGEATLSATRPPASAAAKTTPPAAPLPASAAACQNSASGEGGPGASVSGGERNTARGNRSSVSGGVGNTANGFETVVIGGNGITNNKDQSIAPQPPFP